jgi:hypothetical protein
VVIVGYTYGTLPGQTKPGSIDAIVRKYDADGNEAWTRQFGTSLADYPRGVSVDHDGNVFVVGYTLGKLLGGPPWSSHEDAFLRKYDADGNESWTRQFGTAAYEIANATAVDSAGNVLVAGITNGALPGQTSAGSIDAFVRKYDTDGNESWTRQFGTDASDHAASVSVRSNGEVLVAGVTRGILPGHAGAGRTDAFVRGFDADGSERWTRQFGSDGYDTATSVCADAAGNVLVAGSTDGTLPGQVERGRYNAFVRKYDWNGTEAWTRQIPAKRSSSGEAVAAASDGLVLAGVVHGTLAGTSTLGRGDAFVRKLDSLGN